MHLFQETGFSTEGAINSTLLFWSSNAIVEIEKYTRLEFKLSARHSDDNGDGSLKQFLLASLEEMKGRVSKHEQADHFCWLQGRCFALPLFPLRAQHQAKLVMTFQARHVLVGHGLWLSEERSPCCGSLKKNEKSSSFGKLGIPPSPAG